MIHAVVCVLLAVLGGPMPPERAAEWAQDLDFLRTELPAKHLKAFHTLTQEDWEARIERFKAELPGLDEDAAQVRLLALVAAIGDGHTSVRPKAADRVYPLAFRAFPDGIFVAAALEPQKSALGARLTAIDGRPIAEVVAAVGTIVSHDNEEQVRESVPRLLSVPGVLGGLGVAPDVENITFSLERDGAVSEVVCGPQSGVARGAWLSVPAPTGATAPLVRTDVSRPYWWRAIDDGKVVYVAYNSCREDPQAPFKPFADEVVKAAEDGKRVVIDLRNNSGGDSSVARPLILAMRNRDKGRVLVLIGRRTYSSGMMNAVQLRDGGAVLLGEPTGGKPNSYGEIKSFTLPRTGFEVFYCTKFFRQVDGDPASVEPDVPVETSAADWFGWRDPVLEAALAYAP